MTPAGTKVLLLNPPGERIYMRDYYCSHASKASYYWGPFDLIVLSGILRERGIFETQALDAMHERLSPDETLRRVEALEPDVIIFLTGAVSFVEDFTLMQRVHDAADKPLRLVATGDCVLAESQKFFDAYPFLDAVILNFTSRDIARWLDGEAGPFCDLAVRAADGRMLDGTREKSRDALTLPISDYDLFPFKEYRIPHGRRMPYAGILTDFGCPFKCDYCIGGELGFRLREIDNVIEEMRALRDRGVRELWIKDLTFGANRKRTFELLERMRREGFDFTWVCLSRANVLTDDLLAAMHEAGCHTIQLGVESASDELLEKYTKGVSTDQVRAVVELCRKHDIRILAHYILGLPGDTVESIRETIDYAIELNTAFASFNVAMPRMGTQFRERAIESGLIENGLAMLDNSVSQPVYETADLDRGTLWELRNEAVRRYHVRARFIFKRLFGVRTWYEFTTLFREGLALLRTTMK